MGSGPVRTQLAGLLDWWMTRGIARRCSVEERKTYAGVAVDKDWFDGHDGR